jgi:hypothetical protein
MYQINESLKAVNETFADDDELEEGAKPDFSDIDDDGDKEETALKAAKDAKDDTKTESQQMREWAKSVYETVEDLDETDCCDDETEELEEEEETEELVEANSGPEEAISIIAHSISMNASAVKNALNAANLDPVAVVTALKGKKTIDVTQLSDFIMQHAFSGSISKQALAPIADATGSAFKHTSNGELEENAKATSLGKSAHKDHKRQPTSDPRLMHLMNNDGMRDNSSFNQSPYLKAWLAGYDSMEKNESQQMREESSESRPYVAVHVKKGKTDVTGTSSYGAAQAAAKKWGLKSTAGIDVHLADVKKVATEQQQMREWSNSVYQNYEDKGHIMAQPEGETVDLSLRRYLNAEPTKVQVAENHTPKSLTESYKSFKAKK